jgi:hypothetical protein
LKNEVLIRAGGICEVKGCDADADTVHHILKASVHPEFKDDPDNGIAICGPDHAELERRLRVGGNVNEMFEGNLYAEKYERMLQKLYSGCGPSQV